MKSINLENVQEESSSLPAGGYICRYTKVEDKSEKEYLYMEYDIAEGEFKDYYKHLQERLDADWWGGRYYRSYKPKALPMFKRMCTAVNKSNGKFIFDAGTINNDEKTLIGKLVGIILRDEEYIKADGTRSTRLTVFKEVPVDVIKSGKFKVPDTKKLKEEEPAKKSDDYITIPENFDEDAVPFS